MGDVDIQREADTMGDVETERERDAEILWAM